MQVRLYAPFTSGSVASPSTPADDWRCPVTTQTAECLLHLVAGIILVWIIVILVWRPVAETDRRRLEIASQCIHAVLVLAMAIIGLLMAEGNVSH
jgi:nitrate reductase gamma subunit